MVPVLVIIKVMKLRHRGLDIKDNTYCVKFITSFNDFKGFSQNS